MMKMPITYGEYLEWKKSRHPDKKIETNQGIWYVASDCQEYHCKVVLTQLQIMSIMDSSDKFFSIPNNMKLQDYIINHLITPPLFPHVFWRDEWEYPNDGSIHLHRTWLDANGAKLIPREENK